MIRPLAFQRLGNTISACGGNRPPTVRVCARQTRPPLLAFTSRLGAERPEISLCSQWIRWAITIGSDVELELALAP